MVLLHEEDLQFNLIISKDIDLAIMGSLSYRHNTGPLIEKNECEKDKEIEDMFENDESANTPCPL